MGRRQKHLEQVEIRDLSSEAKGVGRVNDKVVFVDNTIPGDVVEAWIYKRKKKFSHARPLQFYQYSANRITPFCKHFNHCGGCKLQHLPYDQQLLYKQHTVKAAFERIGHLSFPPLHEILSAPSTRHYRNKLEFTFSNKRWLTEEEIHSERVFTNRDALGFHVAGHFDKVLQIEECYLQPDPSNAIRNEVANYAKGQGLTFYDIAEHHGLLRNLVIRTSETGETLVMLCLGEDRPRDAFPLFDHLLKTFPGITSMQYLINEKKNDSYHDLPAHTYAGKDHILEKLGGLPFKIGAKSFFQTNTRQAENLYKTIKQFAGNLQNKVFYDLYSGLGSITLYLAQAASFGVGIEEVEEAVADARENAELNKINNVDFVKGDVRQVLTDECRKRYGSPDLIVLDPPRAGIHKDVVETLLTLAPPQIIYVSCNPSTQARDLALLTENYDIEAVQPVDMFPHTPHIENVVSLQLKNG
jgi:23S rRNA (uracil1939-C5)-methyltransferase